MSKRRRPQNIIMNWDANTHNHVLYFFIRQFNDILPTFGIHVRFVDGSDPKHLQLLQMKTHVHFSVSRFPIRHFRSLTLKPLPTKRMLLVFL